MEHLQRTRLLTVVVLGVIFGAGVLLGRALDVGLELEEGDGAEPAQSEQTERQAEREGRPERRTPLYRQVGHLTAEQDTRIDSIIEAQSDSLRLLRKDFDAFRDTYNARHSEIMEGTREAIKVVLTPEQVVVYDSLIAEYRRSRRRDDSGERRK